MFPHYWQNYKWSRWEVKYIFLIKQSTQPLFCFHLVRRNGDTNMDSNQQSRNHGNWLVTSFLSCVFSIFSTLSWCRNLFIYGNCYCQDRCHYNTYTPSSQPLTLQHDIKSLPHREEIDGSTVRRVHPGDKGIVYYCLRVLLM